MNRPRCTRMASCVRRKGHAGTCTACPSAATLDWDDQRVAADVLGELDWETPWFADLCDEDA